MGLGPWVNRHEVNGGLGVKLINLILPVNDRDIPFQEINENLFSVAMHRVQRFTIGGAMLRFDDRDHV
jgi:hypothetical protein